MSNKTDRKELPMKEGIREKQEPGHFLARASRKGKYRRWMSAGLLLFGDGLLVYMIRASLIDPVYGAAFVAVVSINLGYQL